MLSVDSMGSASSRCGSSREPSPFSLSSHPWSNQACPYAPYPQSYPYLSLYPQISQECEYQLQNAPLPASCGCSQPSHPRRKLERKYTKISNDYTNLEQVTEALSRAGLESSNLIVGIDFTKSARSFDRNSLHYIGSDQNPYEPAISIIWKTLLSFDDDNLIPCFGF